MKKSLKFKKAGVAISIVAAFLVTCWIVVYAANLTVNDSFSQWRTDKMWKILTEDNWNVLMSKLWIIENLGNQVTSIQVLVEGLQQQVNSAPAYQWELIPDWMIAAFYGGCPSWWSQYSTAQVPGSNPAQRVWCLKWDSNHGSCSSNVCWTTQDGRTCTSYPTAQADDCDQLAIVSTCYDGVWDVDPWSHQWASSSCSKPSGWGGSNLCSDYPYEQWPCKTNDWWTEVSKTNQGSFYRYECRKNWQTCVVYTCRNNAYCKYYEWACYYPDPSQLAWVDTSQRCN